MPGPVAGLTTRANVLAWLMPAGTDVQSTPAASALIDRLILSCSDWLQTSYLHRSIPPKDYVLTLNGQDTYTIFSPHRPIISVASVVVNNVPLPFAAVPTQAGYLFDKTRFYSRGEVAFWRGIQNVTISFAAGFQTQDLAVAVPAPTEGGQYLLPVASLSETWNTDRGVSYHGGAALAYVPSGPAQGQYSVVLDNGAYFYVFSAADAQASLDITYGYTPDALVQVVTELVGETFKRRSRIGETGQVVGPGASGAFSQKDANASVLSMINGFINVVPVDEG